LLPALKRLDHNHVPAAAWAWRAAIDRFNRFGIVWWWRDIKQLAGKCDIGITHGTGEDAVMPDAVEAPWQDVSQEASDKLVRCQRHDPLPFGTITPVVLEPEGDASFIERDQPSVQDGDSVGVAGQIR
jgi:hypothetical protein